jgi:RimJ/RimL family protein N-acetyltransferase
MLKGKRVNLRVVEREDLDLLVKWFNNSEFVGEYQDFPAQTPKHLLEKQVLEPKTPELEWKHFIIEKKEGTKIGWIAHYIGSPNFGWIEIGYAIIPSERGKGHGTEAIQLMVDYLFLTKDIKRIQAVVNVDNLSSQKALEKAGLKREGRLRKALWVRGLWKDAYIYSILREEWKEPKLLT